MGRVPDPAKGQQSSASQFVDSGVPGSKCMRIQAYHRGSEGCASVEALWKNVAFVEPAILCSQGANADQLHLLAA